LPTQKVVCVRNHATSKMAGTHLHTGWHRFTHSDDAKSTPLLALGTLLHTRQIRANDGR